MLEPCGEASCSWRAVSPSSDNSGTSSCTGPEHRTYARLAEGYNLFASTHGQRQMYENVKNNTTWKNTGRATRALTKVKPPSKPRMSHLDVFRVACALYRSKKGEFAVFKHAFGPKGLASKPCPFFLVQFQEGILDTKR